MTPEQFLSIAEIKTRCGIAGDALDEQLAVFRDAAIGVVESRTSRHIVDRAALAVKSPDSPTGKEFITFGVYDALPITAAATVTYRTRQDDPGFVRDGSLEIPAEFWMVEHDRVRAYNGRAASGGNAAGVDVWPERDPRMLFETTLAVGIPAGQAPAEFKSAALMLVRELQEGSAMDSLEPHNIVDAVLRDHVTGGLSAANERLFEAEGR